MNIPRADLIQTSQPTTGLLRLEPGGIWIAAPAHPHDPQTEVDLYFGLPAGQRVAHLMKGPDQTGHSLVSNDQALLSPPRSIHSGASAYALTWAMTNTNKDFTDLAPLRIEGLKQ